jgi:hypothetical protein
MVQRRRERAWLAEMADVFVDEALVQAPLSGLQRGSVAVQQCALGYSWLAE